MLKQLKYDLKVLVKRGRLLTMILFITLIASYLSFSLYYHKNIADIGNYSNSYFLIFGKTTPIPTLFMYSLPLFIAIPHSDIDFVETSLKSQLFMKVKKNVYYISKVITSFLVGFSMVAVFLLLIYAFMFVMLKSNTTYFPFLSWNYPNNPESSWIFLYKFYFNFPILYNLFYILLISIYSGFLSVIAYCFSLLIKSRPFVYLSSFFVSIVCILIPMLFRNGIAVWAPQNVYSPFPMTSSNPGIFSIPMGMIFWFIIFTLFIVSVVTYKIRVEE